jgi:hypothetical protein
MCRNIYTFIRVYYRWEGLNTELVVKRCSVKSSKGIAGTISHIYNRLDTCRKYVCLFWILPWNSFRSLLAVSFHRRCYAVSLQSSDIIPVQIISAVYPVTFHYPDHEWSDVCTMLYKQMQAALIFSFAFWNSRDVYTNVPVLLQVHKFRFMLYPLMPMTWPGQCRREWR